MYVCVCVCPGNVPGPIILGLLIDTSCAVWQDQGGQGSQGACWLYDTTTFSTSVAALAVGQKILGTINVTIALLLYKPRPVDQLGVLILHVDEGEGHDGDEVNQETTS